LSLDDPSNALRVHQAINEGRCGDLDDCEACDIPDELEAIGKRQQPAPSLGKTLATHPGHAVDRAFELSDLDYDDMPQTMVRHIILLTDGAWDDVDDEGRSPDELVTIYQDQHPDRSVPVVHGVFISDSTTHVEYGFPPQGCSGGEHVDMSHLERVSELTGGFYFPGTTPQTIAAQFLSLLEDIVIEQQQVLRGVTVTHLQTGESGQSSKNQLLQGSLNDYLSNVPGFNLQLGENSFVFQRIVQEDNSVLDTLLDTIHIYRDTNPRDGDDSDYLDVSCVVRTAQLDLRASPARQVVDQHVDVSASISLSDTSLFAFSDIQVRALTAFADEDAGTVALFHLDGDLINRSGGENGIGEPTFTTSNAAFGAGAIEEGRFSFNIGNIDAYTVELWVHPESFDADQIIFENNSLECGIDDDGRVFVAQEGTRIEASSPLDRDVWSHIGLAQSGQEATLYVNGIPVSQPTALPGLFAGTVYVQGLTNGYLDELRISSVDRSVPVGSSTRLALPEATDITWELAGQSIDGGRATLPRSQWSDAEADFSFSRYVAGEVIVNLFHEGSQEEIRWSKNSNPVSFYVAGAYATAELFDTNGEGHLDKIAVWWTDNTLDASMIDLQSLVQTLQIINPDGKTINLTVEDIVVVENDSLEIILAENSGEDLETGWRAANIELTGLLTVDNIVDRAGPVLKKAVYFAGLEAENADSMEIFFSEPVHCQQLLVMPPEDEYVFYDAGVRNDEVLSGSSYPHPCSDTYLSRISLMIPSGSSIMPVEDSIQLVMGTVDEAGNSPPQNGRLAPIEWGAGNDIAMYPVTEPFIPTVSLIPEPIVSRYGIAPGTRGTVVVIWSRKPLKRQPDGSYGTATAYDAVGNVVTADIPVQASDKNNDYILIWDGLNKRGRVVGSGTYLFIVSVTDIEGFEKTEKIKVGVKR
ncbi:MAG: LamG-like jellyroll fold domain-containing protein, partial [Chitinivibrionales bacterium]